MSEMSNSLKEAPLTKYADIAADLLGGPIKRLFHLLNSPRNDQAFTPLANLVLGTVVHES